MSAPTAPAVAFLETLAQLADVTIHPCARGLPITSQEYAVDDDDGSPYGEADYTPVYEFRRPGARVFVIVSRDGARISLDWLQASPAGAGYGGAILDRLLDIADARDVEIVTIPKGGERKLVEFYEKRAFVMLSSREKWLYRPGARRRVGSDAQ